MTPPPTSKPVYSSALFSGIAVCAWAVSAAASAEDAGLDFFENRVRPVLAERCFDCHSDDAESGLRLDSLAGMLRGGTRGPAIVVGKPNQSLIIRALSHGERLQMPPKEKLPARQIADIATWIKEGARWPDANPLTVRTPGPGDEAPFTDEERSFWAFQPPATSSPPQVSGQAWLQSPIDAFVLARLEAERMRPAPPADKRTLIRRATFDLTGLPPSPAEVAAFLADNSPDAFAKVVDRLLASARYGERWGRHWLDLARYADSNGLDENLAYANAFQYRDYVVAAFNHDKPFDRFVHEQLAGDLLPDDEIEQDAGNRIVATGFLSLGAKMLAEDDPVKMQMDIIDEQIDTVGRVCMGLTLGCARCHDDKFEPIPTADYYSLAGIFKSTRTMENFKVVARWQERPVATAESVRARQKFTSQIAAKQSEIDALVAKNTNQILDQARLHVGDYLLAALRKQRIAEWLASAKVHGNDAATLTKPGVLLIEAENFDRGNVKKDFDGYGKSIGVLVNKGELPNFVEYDVEVASAGNYQLEIRYAAADSRPCKLGLNGMPIKSDAAGKVTGSWHPDTQAWFVEALVPLGKGKNLLRLEHPQFFPHIDKLLLLPIAEKTTGDSLPALSADYEPIPALVDQWQAYLNKVKNDGTSIFAVWNSLVAGHDVASLAGAAAELRDAIVGKSSAPSALELAGRYQERFASIARAAESKAAENAIDEAVRAVLFDADGPFGSSASLENSFAESTKTRLNALRNEKQELEKAQPKLPEAMAVSDDSAPHDVKVHIRGNHLTLGREVPRRFPRIIAGEDQTPIGPQTSGRLELARWLTGNDNPLTARVIVNRIWQGHFGVGLVGSTDNFGRLGQRPTHPKLLDWLAVRFVQSGWSVKQMHRTIMLSSTYQMSTTWNEKAAEIDPENRLLWRMNRRRLEAEAIRDAMLAVSGRLDRSMGGSLLPTANRAYVTSTANVDPVIYESSRRSVYLPVVRSALYDVFQAFDFPDPSVVNASRQSTTVAPQALFMMNSKFAAEQSMAMAEALLADESQSDEDRVREAYMLAYSRPPTPGELDAALAYVQRYYEATTGTEPDANRRRLLAWQSLCRAILAANEFVYIE